MKTITKIEANRSAAVHRKCRVAAYCRVSTEHDDQMESLGHKRTLCGVDQTAYRVGIRRYLL